MKRDVSTKHSLSPGIAATLPANPLTHPVWCRFLLSFPTSKPFDRSQALC